MRFPELPRKGDQSHVSAVRRLDAARDHCGQLADSHAAVEGTSAEPAALHQLDAGRAEVAAREAWLVWIERGY
jgi:hypothetical protein